MRAGNSRLLAASGGTPSSAKGTRHRAVSAMSTRSQWGSIVNPMPMATPFTAAMSGLSNRSSASRKYGKPDSIGSPAASRAISLRSWPAEKARPSPVRTTIFTSSSRRAASSASAAARYSSVSNAFERVGTVERDEPHPVPVLDPDHGGRI